MKAHRCEPGDNTMFQQRYETELLIVFGGVSSIDLDIRGLGSLRKNVVQHVLLRQR